MLRKLCATGFSSVLWDNLLLPSPKCSSWSPATSTTVATETRPQQWLGHWRWFQKWHTKQMCYCKATCMWQKSDWGRASSVCKVGQLLVLQVRGVTRSISSVLLKALGSFVVMLFYLTSDTDPADTERLQCHTAMQWKVQVSGKATTAVVRHYII